jgi:hypothetical protein
MFVPQTQTDKKYFKVNLIKDTKSVRDKNGKVFSSYTLLTAAPVKWASTLQ